jgi:periplasmic copper chaperone A
MKRLLLVFAIALVAAPAAGAHVTLNPNTAEAESFARFDVRVPTERDNPTVSVTLQLPEGLTFVSFQPKEGWRRTVTMERLDPPIEVFGETITERIASVTWTGGSIGPGEFDEFGMSARMPAQTGELVFPALQRYSNGEVVRWIGPPDADEPAPRVTVTPAASEEEVGGEAEATAEATDDDDVEDRANLALGLGAAGLVAGIAALAIGLFRRRT